MTFVAEFMQFAYKNSEKKEKTGKIEQKRKKGFYVRKKEKTILYCIFVDTSSKSRRYDFCEKWKKEEKPEKQREKYIHPMECMTKNAKILFKN